MVDTAWALRSGTYLSAAVGNFFHASGCVQF